MSRLSQHCTRIGVLKKKKTPKILVGVGCSLVLPSPVPEDQEGQLERCGRPVGQKRPRSGDADPGDGEPRVLGGL